MMDVEKNDERLNEELANLYQDILEREHTVISLTFSAENSKPKPPRDKREVLKYVLPFLIPAVVLTIISFFYTSDFLTVLIILLVLLSYGSLFIVPFRETYNEVKDIKQFLKNPISLLLEGLEETIESDVLIIERLKAYSMDALSFAKVRLQSQRELIEQRYGVLIGAVQTTGILPGLVALGLAIFGVGPQKLMFLIACAMVPFYILAYFLYFNLPRINFYTRLIDNEIQSRQ